MGPGLESQRGLQSSPPPSGGPLLEGSRTRQCRSKAPEVLGFPAAASGPSGFRIITLGPPVREVLERLVLAQPGPQVKPSLEPHTWLDDAASTWITRTSNIIQPRLWGAAQDGDQFPCCLLGS